MRRAAVYNRFWPSKGGGERHSGKVAEVLAADGWQVDLVGHAAFDRDDLASHLGLDLSRTSVRVAPDRGPAEMERVSAEYDLFVNATHMSRLRPRGTANAYLCYFPTPLDFAAPPWRRFLLRRVGPLLPSLPTQGGTWHAAEGGLRRAWTWTQGDSVLAVGPGRVTMDIGRPGGSPTELALVGGAEVARVPVGTAFARHAFDLPGEVRLVSDTFTPGGGDTRDLGVAVSRVRAPGAGVRARVAARWPWLLVDPVDTAFLGSYDLVLANSEFTRGWISELWQRESEVLFPPIRIDGIAPAAERAKTIVTVGRFFRPGAGHAKRQLEMVRMFGALAARLPGWTLHVVGGVEPAHEPYLREVEAAAAGQPVEVHANAPRAVVERLLGEASVFWSATGLGESERKAPWNQEHFGMTTVEAMAGGCVPVVIDRAGQREIVRDGVDGFRWSTSEQWAERTLRVATDEALRARLAASAVARAAAFSDAAFAERWREIAAALGR